MWSWQRAQPIVRPRKTVAVVSTRSTAFSMRHSSSIEPASVTVRLLRLKPVAIFCVERRLGEQVAGELLGEEPVERLVAVIGGDHPVAPGPHGAGEVVLVAVGIGKAGAVEPVHRHALAIERRSQQAVDLLRRTPVGPAARNSSISSGAGGTPARSRLNRLINVGRVGLRTGRKPLGFELGEHESVDRVRDPRRVANRRRGRPGDRLERPVALPARALVDPSLEDFDLRRGELLARFWRGHQFVGIRARDAHETARSRRSCPGTITGSLVLRAPSLRSSRKSALRVFESGPWQVKQFCDRIGKTSRRKSTGSSASVSVGISASRARTKSVARKDLRGPMARRARKCAGGTQSVPATLGPITRGAHIQTLEPGRFRNHAFWKLIHGWAAHGGTTPYYRPEELRRFNAKIEIDPGMDVRN